MPTPPKESIKGTKSHQIVAFDFTQKQYVYLVELENFTQSEDFADLSENEQISIKKEIDLQNQAYEALRIRVEDY